jgi:hypothetical protein
MHRLSKTVVLLISQQLCTHSTLLPPTGTGRRQRQGALPRRSPPALASGEDHRMPRQRRRSFSSDSGGNRRRQRRLDDVAARSPAPWTPPPLLSGEPRTPRGSAYTPYWLRIWFGCLVCAVRRRLTVWPTEFCSAAFIRRSRNSGRWRCGGVKGTSAEAGWWLQG